MSEYKEKIINIETGEETWRDYTAEEIAAVKEEQNKVSAFAAHQAQKLSAKTALLEKLGLTAEEAAALLS
jgi:hypothetical protein